MEYKQSIIEWKEFQVPEHLKRLLDADLNIDFITTITGPRRAGKTYFCFQLIQKLISEGIPKENILYINFEDNKLLGASADDLDKLLETFLEISTINKKYKMYLFLDEIQTVKDWDAWARKTYDTRKDIVLILTGSSSKLLSREISTKLRGRVINKEVLPLSFKEILNWSNTEYDPKTVAYSKDKINVKKMFNRFLLDGGYPAIFVNNADSLINITSSPNLRSEEQSINARQDNQRVCGIKKLCGSNTLQFSAQFFYKNITKEMILQSYYDSMIFKDIVERHRIEDIKKLRVLAQLLFQSVSGEISYNSLANKLKSLGFKISKNTIIEYVSYFEDAYLFFQNLKYEYSLAKQLGSIKKLYCIDNGLLNSVSFKFSEDIGKLLENTVFIELKRRKETIYYHRKNHECDFLIATKNRVIGAIQVTTKLDDKNSRRETSGLLEALREHKLEEGIILTEDQEETKIIDGKKIIIMPVWRWLLG